MQLLAGDTYLVLDRPLSSIIQHLAKGLEDRIRRKWPVSVVEHSSTGAVLHGPSGEHTQNNSTLKALYAKESGVRDSQMCFRKLDSVKGCG